MDFWRPSEKPVKNKQKHSERVKIGERDERDESREIVERDESGESAYSPATKVNFIHFAPIPSRNLQSGSSGCSLHWIWIQHGRSFGFVCFHIDCRLSQMLFWRSKKHTSSQYHIGKFIVRAYLGEILLFRHECHHRVHFFLFFFCGAKIRGAG